MEIAKREIVVPGDFTQPEYYGHGDYISENIPELKNIEPDRVARKLYRISQQALKFAHASFMLDLSDDEIVRAYKLCLHASSAVMRLHGTPNDQTIPITLPTFGFFDEPEIHVQAMGRDVPLFMEVWPRMMYLSWLLRDDIGIRTLREIPKACLEDNDGTPIGGFAIPYVELEYACGIEKPAGEISSIYQQFIDGLDPATFHESDPDGIREIAIWWSQQASLLVLNSAKNADPQGELTDYYTEFKSIYIEALEFHKQYAEHGTYDRSPNLISPEFWASIPLMGVASQAHDLGIKVDVDSDYAPLRFVTGEVLKSV